MYALLPILLALPLAKSAMLHMYPPPSDKWPVELSPNTAMEALSLHLGLPTSERAGAPLEKPIIGKGGKPGLFLAVDEKFWGDVFPSDRKLDYRLSPPPSLSSAKALVASLESQARQVYTVVHSRKDSAPGPGRTLDIFSSHPSTATKHFLTELDTLSSYLEDSETHKFLALELTGVAELAATYGRTSEVYKAARDALRAAVTSLAVSGKFAVVVATLPDVTLSVQGGLKAQASGQCFSTADACKNSTGSCSGRGTCQKASKAGKTCYQCACKATKVNQKTEYWVGEKCEKKDVSGPFVLLTGTVIGLIILIGGSISLIATIGSQELPSVLGGGGAAVKKD